MTQITGGCLCGEVRIVATGAPRRVGICHCLDCRKHHGALFFAAAIFPATAITISGAPSSVAMAKLRYIMSACDFFWQRMNYSTRNG